MCQTPSYMLALMQSNGEHVRKSCNIRQVSEETSFPGDHWTRYLGKFQRKQNKFYHKKHHRNVSQDRWKRTDGSMPSIWRPRGGGGGGKYQEAHFLTFLEAAGIS